MCSEVLIVNTTLMEGILCQEGINLNEVETKVGWTKARA